LQTDGEMVCRRGECRDARGVGVRVGVQQPPRGRVGVKGGSVGVIRGCGGSGGCPDVEGAGAVVMGGLVLRCSQ